MWRSPTIVDDRMLDMATQLGCGWIGAVDVKSDSAYEYDDCHNNVIKHVNLYGGDHVVGYYLIEGFGTIQAIRHSVWHDGHSLIDITPYRDGRDYIIFAKDKQQKNKTYKISNCYIQSLDKYKSQEIEIMYYVYQLVDPRTEKPFYIGKGTGNRATTHLTANSSTPNVHKQNKIDSIRRAGLEPKIEYIAENIIDEALAYDIETKMIQKYGRKGYDPGGILTNICEDNRPPNHKGKTYEEIYGVERAKYQREMRSRLQKERGGYGPEKHSKETREKFSKLTSGSGNPMYGKKQKESTKALISEKAKQKVGAKNKNSFEYKLTSPAGEEFTLYGGDALNFCKKQNLSWSTLKKQVEATQWGIPKKGKTKGWKLEVISKK